MKFNFFKKQKPDLNETEFFSITEENSYTPDIYRGVQIYENDDERFCPFDEDYFAGEEYDLPKRQIKIKPPKTPPSFFLGMLCAALLIVSLSGGIAFLTLFSKFGGIHRTVTVPALTALTEEQALEALKKEQKNFNYKIKYANNPNVPDGTVISQMPLASAQRKIYGINEKLTVNIVISKKSSPITVPNLTGQSSRDIELELKNAGINVIIEELYSKSVDTGKIIAQSANAGSKLYPNDTVTLTVSAGPPIKYSQVPNVIGLSESKAISLLTVSGFKISSVTYEESALPQGTVTAQSIDSGASLRSGSPIALSVSIGTFAKKKK